MEKGFFKAQITLTWSKAMSLIIVLTAFVLDMNYNTNGTIYMYALPFAVALITGKQILDRNKEKNNGKNETPTG